MKKIAFLILLFINFSPTFSQSCEIECQNLIQNPELNYIIDPTSGLVDIADAFEDGLIPNWNPSINSPHLMYFDQEGNCQTLPYDPSNNNLLLTCIASTGGGNEGQNNIYLESIYTSMDFIQDPFLTYCVEISASYISCPNGQPQSPANMFVRAANNLSHVISYETSFPDFPVPGTGQIIMNETVSLSAPQTYTINNFMPNANYNALEIYQVRETSNTTAILNVRKADVNCFTSALGGILATIDGSIVTFEAINDGNFDFVEFNWDLGNGIFSNEEIVQINYGETGEYEVCLDIIDENGCCASRCINIEIIETTETICNEAPLNSLFINGNNAAENELSELISQGVFNSNGSYSNENYLIDGVFYIDEEIQFSNCNFYFAPGAELVIQPNGLIRIINSTLSGCDMMWKGISVEGVGNSNFTFIGNTISDAYTAIDIKEGSNVIQSRNTFDRNFIGVYSAPSTFTKTHYGSDITGSLFSCTDDLLPPYVGQPKWNEKSFAGIYCSDLNQLIVQEKILPPFGTEITNEFTGLTNGILVRNTNLIATKNQFRKMIGDSFDDNISFATKGFGILSNESPILHVERNRFSGGFKAVVYDDGMEPIININQNSIGDITGEENTFYYSPIRITNLLGGKLTVNQNEIYQGKSSYSLTYGDAAVSIINATNLKTMNVNNNIINSSLTNAAQLRIAKVTLGLNSEGSQYHGFVKDNEIEVSDLNSLAQNAAYLNFVSCENLSVENNYVLVNTLSAGHHVNILNTSDCHFRSNRIESINSKISGFLVTNSPLNVFCCNSVVVPTGISQGSVSTGFTFIGQNNGTDFKQNSDENSLVGLSLVEGIIGQQFNASNIFNSDEDTRATLITGGNPSQLAELSKFIINYADSETLPKIIIPGTISTLWFENDPSFSISTCGENLNCGIPKYEVTGDLVFEELMYDELLNKVKNEQLSGNYKTYSEWEMALSVFKKLKNASVANWEEYLNAQENDIISKYAVIQYLEIVDLIEARELFLSENELGVQIEKIHENFLELSDKFLENSIEVKGMIDDLKLIMTEYDFTVETYDSEAKDLLEIATNKVTKIDKNSDFEKKLYTIVYHFLLYLQENGEINSYEVHEIANLCKLEFGTAVALAETYQSLNEVTVANSPLNCSIDETNIIEEREDADRVIESRVNIYPNPTDDGSIQLVFDVPTTTNGTVEAFSTDGIMVFSTNFGINTDALFMQLHDYKGVLLIKVFSEDGIVNSSKIIISN